MKIGHRLKNIVLTHTAPALAILDALGVWSICLDVLSQELSSLDLLPLELL
mgnify:CR=1 FL=1